MLARLLLFSIFITFIVSCPIRLIQFTETNTFSVDEESKYAELDKKIIEAYRKWDDIKIGFSRHQVIYGQLECSKENIVKINKEEYYIGSVVPSQKANYEEDELVNVYTLFNVVYRLTLAGREPIYMITESKLNSKLSVVRLNADAEIEKKDIEISELKVDIERIKAQLPPDQKDVSITINQKESVDWPFWVSIAGTGVSAVTYLYLLNNYKNTSESDAAIRYRQLSQVAGTVTLSLVISSSYFTCQKFGIPVSIFKLN